MSRLVVTIAVDFDPSTQDESSDHYGPGTAADWGEFSRAVRAIGGRLVTCELEPDVTTSVS